jgi:hypothetical protein
MALGRTGVMVLGLLILALAARLRHQQPIAGSSVSGDMDHQSGTWIINKDGLAGPADQWRDRAAGTTNFRPGNSK